jgi:hypothetical protein
MIGCGKHSVGGGLLFWRQRFSMRDCYKEESVKVLAGNSRPHPHPIPMTVSHINIMEDTHETWISTYNHSEHNTTKMNDDVIDLSMSFDEDYDRPSSPHNTKETAIVIDDDDSSDDEMTQKMPPVATAAATMPPSDGRNTTSASISKNHRVDWQCDFCPEVFPTRDAVVSHEVSF